MITELKVDIRETGYNGRNCFLSAVRGSKIDTMKYLHSIDETLCQARDITKSTALNLACLYSSKETIECLINEFGVDIHETGYRNWNCLLSAVAYGRKEIIEYLISVDKDLMNAQGEDGENALSLAIIVGQLEVHNLLKNEYNIEDRLLSTNQKSEFDKFGFMELIQGLNYLESAVATDNVDVVDKIWKESDQGILKREVDLCIKASRSNNQLLKLALKSAGVEMLKLILSQDFDINFYESPNSFFIAIEKGDLQVLKHVQSLSPELYLETNSITKTTSLCEAFRHRHVVKYLIEDLNFQYKEPPKNILLHAASFYYSRF